ncbi:MAG: putative ABC transporter permease subunit, partial [Thermoanaerobaculia bacterium]
MWSLRILTSRLRPFNAATIARTLIVAAVFFAFLYGDYVLFRRLFRAVAKVEEMTPLFAIGLLRNLLAMVFLVSVVMLFSSSMTSAIGSFFTDLDLDLYHSAPRSKLRIVIARWGKTLAQSATIVFLFLIPLFVAYALQYRIRWQFIPIAMLDLALLLTIPVTLASLLIVLLVRWFPVRHVHQIVATMAMIVLTMAVVAFRMSRPERFFTNISTDDVARVLSAIELPSMERYPGTALADVMARNASGQTAMLIPLRILIPAVVLFAIFVIVARAIYFRAFVRARESMAPVAIGAGITARALDRLIRGLRPQLRAMIAKEVRTVSRDVAQWSQVFLSAALLFIYVYNIRMLPLGGDRRATIIAYANLGMAGFVVAGICMRFAYPSVSAEGKAFWLVRSAPIAYRDFLRVKVFVYGAPLILVSMTLTAFANIALDAPVTVWMFTMTGAALLAITLVSLGVALGALMPNFAAENPLQVGLSLGGFAYMALSLGYVGVIMTLMARPVMQYFFWKMLGFNGDRGWVATLAPVAVAVILSAVLSVVPLIAAERRLVR